MNITHLNDARLFDECVNVTTQAAYGAEGAYERAMELMQESKVRHRRLPGYVSECGGDIYSRALAQAQATQLFQEPHLPTCDCGVAS